MRTIVKLLIAVAFAAALSGCVIRPWYGHRWHHADLGLGGPAVIVNG
jgi:hypothetical protein